MRDVARAAGVSLSAVSQALSGTGRIAESTRQRVRAVAERLGYRPNPLMAALASRAHRTDRSVEGTPIAYLTLNSPEPLRADFARLPVLLEHGERLGYRVHHYELREFPTAARLQRLLHARGTAGVLIGPLFERTPAWSDLRWERFPVVVISDNPFRLPFHHVKEYVGLGVRTAIEQAHRLGYRRIGVALMYHDWALDDDFDRRTYALGALAHVGPADVPIWREPFSRPDEAGFLRWAHEHRPEVVIGFPSAFHWRLQNAGWRVPEDVAIISLNQGADEHGSGFAGFADLRGDLARQGVELLDLLIRHHRCGEMADPPIHFIRRPWQPGASLPDRRPVASSAGGRRRRVARAAA